MKLTSQNTLDTRVGAMVETWHEAADLFNQHIFSGNPIGLNGNLDLLKRLIMDGKFAGSDLDLLSAEELNGHIKKALYGQLIPLTWASSTCLQYQGFERAHTNGQRHKTTDFVNEDWGGKPQGYGQSEHYLCN
ncbi:hypothetical protein BGZ61DRAFT_473886 [Ilyonectria robusta]|uniref:uncharacterized protein n=1 Tax=Ilyonectria robusta TaxID=1079257 RepID=UPI001E8CB2E2|nr:uncharacterized protein BGZ61DRAFT_473886 [Ilyonectria robusta]KAH8735279.1 hypothetical protein BGZ61DRAFT_473886 [Ilyonectria robusta]